MSRREVFANWSTGTAVKLLRRLAIVVIAIAVLESALAWAFLAKRIIRDEPVVDLIEQYAVLRPFRFLFPDQYKFPTVLLPNFVEPAWCSPQILDSRSTFWLPPCTKCAVNRKRQHLVRYQFSGVHHYRP